jgi:uncharacterized membrane protein YeaQ/YmgE (transglycosylase-associated protein family)
MLPEIDMTADPLLIMPLVGLLAGWLAGMIVRGTGFGLIGDIVIGIIGAFVGNWLFQQLGVRLGSGIGGEVVTATIGAVVLCSSIVCCGVAALGMEAAGAADLCVIAAPRPSCR